VGQREVLESPLWIVDDIWGVAMANESKGLRRPL
jgi:hypothetical protein